VEERDGIFWGIAWLSWDFLFYPKPVNKTTKRGYGKFDVKIAAVICFCIFGTLLSFLPEWEYGMSIIRNILEHARTFWACFTVHGLLFMLMMT
jgi:hypothetical protein